MLTRPARAGAERWRPGGSARGGHAVRQGGQGRRGWVGSRCRHSL